MNEVNSTAAQRQQQSDGGTLPDSPARLGPDLTVEPPTFRIPWNRRLLLFEILENGVALFRPVEHVRGVDAYLWSNVFVSRPFPVRGVFDSVLVHVFFALAVYSATLAFTPPALVDDHVRRETLTYYTVSEYLPEVRPADPEPSTEKTSATRAKVSDADRAADPTYAPQEIIALPKEPERSRQTIVAPTALKLNRDVALPNIVASTAMPQLERPLELKPTDNVRVSDISAPALSPKLTTPMEIVRANASMPTLAEQPLQVAQGRGINGPAMLKENVPAPSLQVKPGLPNLAGTKSLPILRPGIETETKSIDGAIASVPVPQAAPPQTSGTAGNQTVMALSAHPATSTGPPSLPQANRRGEFTSTPNGNAGASGNVATVKAPAGDAGSTPKDGASNGGNGDHGVSIARHPLAPATNAPVVSSAPANKNDDLRDKLMAAARAPNLPPNRVEPNQQKTVPQEPADETARTVFGEKRYYTLTINMPNLTSAAGSWIIRFAELHPSIGGTPLATPVATSKADPAYPQDLMKDKVEGTVILYAIIRADGVVSDVRVLRSLDTRLDENAMKAIKRWKFQPGSKDGKPVDVEAVVQVPFRVRKLQF